MFVPTRSSLLKNKSEDSCKTFVFETKKRTKSAPHEPKSADEILKQSKKQAANVTLKKLRYEVIKFGSSGLEGSKKEESRMALAVSLGAKPPKRKGRNYKEILAEKKKEKDNLVKTNKQDASNLLLKKREMNWKGRRGKETTGLLRNYGKVKLNKK